MQKKQRPDPRQSKPKFSNIPKPSPFVRSHKALTCQIQGECQSCAFVNDPYEKSLLKKHEAGLSILKEYVDLASTKILPPNASPKRLGYRTTAKLAVRPVDPRKKTYEAQDDVVNRFDIGLFIPESHQVIDLPACPIHAPLIQHLLNRLKKELNLSTLNPWNEKTGEGDLRYLVIRMSHVNEEFIITFVATNTRIKSELRKVVQTLKTNFRFKIHGAFLNLNSSTQNKILGDETILVLGKKKLRESICDLSLAVSPESFFQVNPWLAAKLYRRVEHIAGVTSSIGAVAWDLYCGIGQMGMMLARSGYKTFGVEENPFAIEDAKENARANDLEHNIEFVCSKVEQATTIPAWALYPRVVVANPSRHGLAPQALELVQSAVKRTPSSTFIYVSCDVRTLARDLKNLLGSGLKLRQIEAFDMFAQTDKLEWLAVLES